MAEVGVILAVLHKEVILALNLVDVILALHLQNHGSTMMKVRPGLFSPLVVIEYRRRGNLAGGHASTIWCKRSRNSATSLSGILWHRSKCDIGVPGTGTRGVGGLTG